MAEGQVEVDGKFVEVVRVFSDCGNFDVSTLEENLCICSLWVR